MQAPEISFQKATVAEVDLISKMAREIWTEVYADLISAGQIEYMLEWMYSPDTLRREMAEEDISYIWISGEESPFGYLAFSLENTTAHLHKLYLNASLHGRGIGSAALRWLEGHCLSKGAQTIQLRVNKSNHPAVRAYERNGFSRIDSICQDIGGGYVMDDHIFKKDLRK